MKKTFIALAVLMVAGCSGKNPYQPAPQVLQSAVVTESQTTKRRAQNRTKLIRIKPGRGKLLSVFTGWINGL